VFSITARFVRAHLEFCRVYMTLVTLRMSLGQRSKTKATLTQLKQTTPLRKINPLLYSHKVSEIDP